MKTIQGLMLAYAAALAFSPVYAQNSSVSAGATAPAVLSTRPISKADGKKATRAENRRFSSIVQRAIYDTNSVGDADILVFGNAATGSVVLVGYVFDPKQVQVAIEAARRVIGVTDVTSRLMIQDHDD
jgi:hyperosmotically inducible protein